MRFSFTGNVRPLKRKSLFGQAVVALLTAELLMLSAFTAVSLPTATGRNLRAWAHNQAIRITAYLPEQYKQQVIIRFPELSAQQQSVRRSLYTPIVPTAVFTGYILGPQLGAIAAALYIIAGLLGPNFGIYLFASGGGWSYYREPGLGYLIGLAVACWCAGRLTNDPRKSLKQLLAVLCSVALVHIFGIAYVLVMCVVAHFSLGGDLSLLWYPWALEEIRNLSWYQLPYDLLFSLLLIGISFPIRWLVSALTVPDTTIKSRFESQLEELIE